jgi:putative addiction module component (TIGR02574 family)
LGGAGISYPGAVEFPDHLEESPAMDTDMEKLEPEALKLAAGARPALAQRLLGSLEGDAAVDEAWAREVERRIAEVESGAGQLLPMEDALVRVRVASN